MKTLLLGAVGLVLAVSALWSTGRSISAAPVTAAPARCQNIQLAVSPGQSNGAAGHMGIQYRMQNVSGRTCRLYGYPGAVLLNANFATLPTYLRRSTGYLGTNPGPRPAVLAPGRSAYFFLEWVHFPSPGQTCPPARYLMITPPNDGLPVVTWAARGGRSITPCGGNVVTSPVEPRPVF